jgi:hypothetical protein
MAMRFIQKVQDTEPVSIIAKDALPSITADAKMIDPVLKFHREGDGAMPHH